MKKITPIIYLRFLIVCVLIPFTLVKLQGQSLEYSKSIINELCSEKYAGRGYVNNGVNNAAKFLENEFSRLKLKRFGNSYLQQYSFPVNTHPSSIYCKVDKSIEKAGTNFLVDAASPSIQGRFQLRHYNTRDSLDQLLLSKKIKKGFEKNDALVLHFGNKRNSSILDSCMLYRHNPSLIIYTEEKKLTHTISQKIDDIPSLHFLDSAIKQKETIEIDYTNNFINDFTSTNLIGYIKAKRSDSFIVFSAHYDHLGMMGKDAMFPGASDNASGTSMILYLANYYSKYKPKDNIVFILFSGEEAGLMGSSFFTSHPTFDIQKIKMLVNIDIMGNADKGITVVNGEVYKPQFDLLTSINKKGQYLPEIKIRRKAKNSDHYYFSEKGIPAFFIYSNGGKGYYHDIYDKADQLELTNYEQVAKLLIEFASKI